MFKKVIVVLVIGMLATPALAKRKRSRRVAEDGVQQTQTQELKKQVKTKEKKIEKVTKVTEAPTQKEDPVQIWRKGSDTVVQLKGQAFEDSASCKDFQIQLQKALSYNIQCIGHEMADTLALTSGPGHTVTQRGDHITITKYNYLMKKPRVSKLRESTLKVPFVEKIIHIKKSEDGSLAFYYESFREDEFGRIVQDGFVQAHSLTNKPMKISAN